MTGAPRYDVIVVGGGPAGLTAALYLGRSRRRTLVLDGGSPRNAAARHSHGVFARDGTPPSRLLDDARRQLGAYGDVEFRAEEALSAQGRKGQFTVRTTSGDVVEGGRLLVACGVRDELPAIPGLAELWGTAVHSCAYCHGYEERDRPLAVMAEAAAALPAVALLLNLSRELVLCTNGSSLAPADRRRIEQRAVEIIDVPLERVDRSGDGLDLWFSDGSRLRRAALFLKAKPYLASNLPEQLGCRLDGPARVVVGQNWETDIPGVYAAGDIAADKKFVSVAAASGAEAAVAIDGELAQEQFGGRWNGPICANLPQAVRPEPWPPGDLQKKAVGLPPERDVRAV